MTVQLLIFMVLGVLAIASAVGVISMKSPIASAMSLVVHFIALAGLYLSLNALFMAAIQVLVYAGAIMVLVVFVIMLLNLGSEEKLRERLTSPQTLGVAISMLVGGGIIFAIAHLGFSQPSGNLPPGGSVEAIGTALFTDYIYPFEMVSLILLAAAVGAVVLSKRHVE